jgi:hypothetical protein
MRKVSKQNIKEAVGVPANIEVASQNLYNDIAKKIKNKEIGPEDVVKLKFINKDGRYSFGDFNPNFITVEFGLGTYSGDAIDNNTGNKITGGLVHSMGFSKASKLNDVFDLISVDTDGGVELNIDYAQPNDDEEWSGNKILDTMEKNKSNSISSLGHELKHAYDNYKKPVEKLVDRSNYAGFQRSRSGVRPMDQFMFNMYFINQIENLVRPTESYVEMVSDGVVTKEQFLKFLLNSKTYKTLVQIRDSSFDKLIEDLKGYETEIDDYLNNTVDNYDSSSLDIDDKVKYFLKVFAFATARKVHEVRKQLLTPVTNLFQMLFGGNDNPEADKFLDSTLGDLVKMMDNPNKFYYTSIENMKKIAIKMMKKLSKLYSLINKDKTITVETRDPMSFEMDQLYRKITKKNNNIIDTKIDERFLKKK